MISRKEGVALVFFRLVARKHFIAHHPLSFIHHLAQVVEARLQPTPTLAVEALDEAATLLIVKSGFVSSGSSIASGSVSEMV